MEKFYLELPSLERKDDAIEYINEFYKYNSQIHGTGSLDRRLKKGISYEEWMNDSLMMADKDYAYSKGLVPSTTFYLIRENDNKIVGMIDLRYELNDYLRNFGGNIGYSIRPTERKKGYNKINLFLCLLKAQEYGLENVLITCADYNQGSKNTIKSFGGLFEKNNFDESDNETMELYWINVNNSIEKNHEKYIDFISNKNINNKLTKDYSEASDKDKKLIDEKYKKVMTSNNTIELLNNQNLQYENEQFKIYAPYSLKEISKDMAITSSERVSDIFEFFDIKSFRKVQVNLFDNKEEFRKFIATIRGIEENKIPEYCTGTYDKGMINCFIDLKLLKNDIYYKKRTYTLAHEFIHIIYLEFILNNDFYKRVTWLDEGVAQYLSGEMKDLDFDKFYNDIIDNLKEVPNLNNLNHGKSFVNDKYNGYALAYITVKYLSETTDLLEVLKSYDKSLEVGESALKEALEYYKNKKVINTK